MYNDDTLLNNAMLECKRNYDLRASLKILSAKGEEDSDEEKSV